MASGYLAFTSRYWRIIGVTGWAISLMVDGALLGRVARRADWRAVLARGPAVAAAGWWW